MATPDGVFYAYVGCPINPSVYRYIITFQNQSVADQWWRAVTDSVVHGETRFKDIVRLSNQWYTHTNSYDIINTIIVDKVAKSLAAKMFFTLLGDSDGRNIPVAPVLNYVAPSSGSQFFIRSVLQPGLFWYYDVGTKRVRASPARRTRFTVKIAQSVRPIGTIMIPEDQVVIEVAANNDPIGVDDKDGSLTIRKLATTLTFSDFSGAFGIHYDDDITNMSVVKMQDTTEAEKWEFAF